MDVKINDASSSELYPSNLCGNCQGIFDLWSEVLDQNRTSFLHCENVFALEASAVSGCQLCVVFLNSLHGCDLQHARTNAPKAVIDDLRSIPVEVQLSHINIDVDIEYDWHLSLNAKILQALKIQRPDNLDLIGRSIRVVPSSWPNESYRSLPTKFSASTKDALHLAKQWLDKCSTSHHQCNVKTRRTPSRLLSLSNNSIRLCLPGELSHSPQYATLSHCWGSLVIPNLTRSNVQAFREKVPPEAISKTFEHAIYIARYMGLEYLWIDSLCIIQDDVDDWAMESANMSSVYGSSSLNIAASFAPDGTHGCFVDRGRSDIYRILVRAKVRNEDRFFECLPPEIYRRGLAEMPLLQRGWVVQERVLSPKMLHFTTKQVFWECFEEVACEIFPRGLPEQTSDAKVFFDKKHFVGSMWPGVIELYSRCKLTYDRDKMVAISGLAEHIASQTNEGYVAGLWRKGIERQLCWRRREPRQQRPLEYQAPTWSWASINRWVRHLPLTGAEHCYVKILEVHVTPSGQNILGAVSEASMRLECYLFPQVTMDDRKNLTIAGRKVYIQRFLDCMPETEKSFWVLPILYHENRNPQELAYGTVGLLLRPTGRSPDQYQREGIFYAQSLQQSDVSDLARESAVKSEPATVGEDGRVNMKCIIELV